MAEPSKNSCHFHYHPMPMVLKNAINEVFLIKKVFVSLSLKQLVKLVLSFYFMYVYIHTHLYIFMLQTNTLGLLMHFITYSFIAHAITDSLLYSLLE